MASTSVTRLLAGVGAIAALSFGTPAAAASQSRGVTPSRTSVSGQWTGLVSCAPTSYNPLTQRLTCVGSTLWQGSWSGITRYTIDGKLNLVTGDASGTIDETFWGSASDGSRGTLHFHETLTVKGSSGAVHIVAHIVGATGDFAGSKGWATFDGTETANAVSVGTYSGRWIRPQQHGGRRA